MTCTSKCIDVDSSDDQCAKDYFMSTKPVLFHVLLENQSGKNFVYLNSQEVHNYLYDNETMLNQGMLLRVKEIKQLEHKASR